MNINYYITFHTKKQELRGEMYRVSCVSVYVYALLTNTYCRGIMGTENNIRGGAGVGKNDNIDKEIRRMTKYQSSFWFDDIVNSPTALFICGLLAIVLGVFFCYINGNTTPVPRSEAIYYEGYFDCYDDSSENYREIQFSDGSAFQVFAHTESEEFNYNINALPRGTKLYLLINPNSDYVAEVRTEDEELLNFEVSQKEIHKYHYGYIGIGIFVVAVGVFLIVYGLCLKKTRRKEQSRKEKIKQSGGNTKPEYRVDPTVKARILLETKVDGLHICYRRCRSVNELVINGQVYDTRKGIIEFEHELCATVCGHTITAGLDGDSNSFITVDGETVKEKKRYF